MWPERAFLRACIVTGAVLELSLLAGCSSGKTEGENVDTTLPEEPAATEAKESFAEVTETADVPQYSANQYSDNFEPDPSQDEESHDTPADLPDTSPTVRVHPVALGNAGLWVTPNDYPSRALREEREGKVVVSLSVNEQGRVSDCLIASSSGSPDLDETSCAVMRRRARYSPATDQYGSPVASTMQHSINWILP